MNISRRVALIGPLALLIPTVPASAAVTVATPVVPFADDPARRAALRLILSAVRNTREIYEKFANINHDNIPEYWVGYFGWDPTWLEIDCESIQAEWLAVNALEQAHERLRKYSRGTPIYFEHNESRELRTSAWGILIGALPISPADGTGELLAAIETFLPPDLAKG